MGRKIPSKKHRGVKDPLQQQAKRLESLKGKINAPPKDPDEQPVPQSLTRLFAFQDRHKNKVEKKKKQPTIYLNDRSSISKVSRENPVAKLCKLPGESGRSFSLRINSAVKALHHPGEDLDDYPQDMESEDYKGQTMAEHRERRAKKRRRAGNNKKEDDQEHLTRTQKLALKKKAKKEKALEASNEKQEVVYERVSFGDVSHAPPALHFKARGNQQAPGAARPGRRDLLLSSMLGAPGGAAGAGGPARGVPAAELLRRERNRLDAVAAYRALKAEKHKQRHK